MFTVRTGTIFEETPLAAARVGLRVLESMRSKKGIARCSLSREMEITHKSALFVLRRIRHGLGRDEQTRRSSPAPSKLMKRTSAASRAIDGAARSTGRGTRTRRRFSAMVQRDGDVRFRMMERLTADRLVKCSQRMQT